MPPKTKRLVSLAVLLLVFVSVVIFAFSLFRQKGNYGTALVLYNKLQNFSSEDKGVIVKATEAEKLVVAEENFLKAKEAAVRENWTDVKSLLENTDAVSNVDFKFYDEAVVLLNQAKEIVASFERESVNKISGLEQEAQNEKTKRQESEKNLQATEEKLKATQNEVANAKSLFEKEKLEKFINELNVYLGLFSRGNDYLDSVISAINGGHDVTALIFISQAKVLFDEAQEKALAFRSGLDSGSQIEVVSELVRAGEFFGEAALSLRNAVIYMEDRGSGSFSDNFQRGESSKAQAVNLLEKVREYIISF